MSSYIVTGVAGFIAARITEMLLADGHSVLGLDNLDSASYSVQLKHWRLARLFAKPGFTFRQLDVANWSELQLGMPTDASPRAVIHLAARAGVRQSVNDPWAYMTANVTGTLNMLEYCRDRRINKFVFASSSSLYGSNNTVPFHEEAVTDRPLSPYAASKKAAEAVCYSYHHLHGLDISILRYFTVYGPASRPDMSPFRFTQWISEDRPVILYGDGLQQRDFTYVDDIACGTIAALKPLGYATINLGSDSPISMREMIGLVEKNMGQRAHITLKAAHPADVRATWADISRAKELLEWQPQVNYEEGFKRLVRWYVDNRDWASLIDTAELPDKEASATASPVAAHLS